MLTYFKKEQKAGILVETFPPILYSSLFSKSAHLSGLLSSYVADSGDIWGDRHPWKPSPTEGTGWPAGRWSSDHARSTISRRLRTYVGQEARSAYTVRTYIPSKSFSHAVPKPIHLAVSLLLRFHRPPSTQLFSPIEIWPENGPITTD